MFADDIAPVAQGLAGVWVTPGLATMESSWIPTPGDLKRKHFRDNFFEPKGECARHFGGRAAWFDVKIALGSITCTPLLWSTSSVMSMSPATLMSM